ncbi:GntR family transcriptional regulator [Streptomyces sp. NPDC047002]|uniref:GntR family transcriptional regulator n=1 Tax=Streptomyces sp. NPDC047002 TaxID=3155475 RepID=UPI00345599AC
MANNSRYAGIADVLAAEIADRPAGSRVASEHEIAGRFHVSRAAARAAVQELEQRLLVRRVRGAGTFVNRRTDLVLSRRQGPSLHETVRQAGGVARTVVRDVRLLPLPAAEAGLLERPPGSPAHLLARQSYIDGLLSVLALIWIPSDVLTEVGAAVHAVESLDTILRQMGGVEPVRAWCRVSCAVPAPEIAAQLETECGREVPLIESLSRDRATGLAVLCSSMWNRPDRTRVVVELDGPWQPPGPPRDRERGGGGGPCGGRCPLGG